MRAKEFFLRVSRAEKELKLIRAQIRHYEDIGYNISPRHSEAPGSGSKSRNVSKVEIAALGILEGVCELREQEKEYVRIIEQAKKVIEAISQEKYRQLLTLHYLCGWSFRSVSDELDYHDPNSVYRAHGWALVEAQKILNKEGKNVLQEKGQDH